MMKTAVIYLYSKKLFQNSLSFFLKFCVAALLLLTAALGFGNLLFRFENTPSSGAVSSNEKITVVIDPGHGGRDGGAVGDDGTLEKQESTYDGKEKCFVVTHFSDYVIVYSAPNTSDNAGGLCNILWIILIIIILVCVTVYLILKKRKQDKVKAEKANH